MGIAASKKRDGGRLKDIRAFIDELYAHDLHAKRVDSLSAALRHSHISLALSNRL